MRGGMGCPKKPTPQWRTLETCPRVQRLCTNLWKSQMKEKGRNQRHDIKSQRDFRPWNLELHGPTWSTDFQSRWGNCKGNIDLRACDQRVWDRRSDRTSTLKDQSMQMRINPESLQRRWSIELIQKISTIEYLPHLYTFPRCLGLMCE